MDHVPCMCREGLSLVAGCGRGHSAAPSCHDSAVAAYTDWEEDKEDMGLG